MRITRSGIRIFSKREQADRLLAQFGPAHDRAAREYARTGDISDGTAKALIAGSAVPLAEEVPEPPKESGTSFDDGSGIDF